MNRNLNSPHSVSALLTAGCLMALLTASVFAQSTTARGRVRNTLPQVEGAQTEQPQIDLQQGGVLDILERQKKAIVGSWTIPDPEGIPTLVTFHEDGTLVETDVDHTFSGGRGVWQHLGGRQFAYTWVQYKKDDQEQKGAATVFGTVTLNETNTRFTGPLHFEFAEPNGNVVDSDASLGLTLVFDGARIRIRQ
ncbi:MAG: hypothetical protein HY011_18810 [Acidobacteria bacterium]|nr:hypothetical protein [Acidobacteriota bacterium]